MNQFCLILRPEPNWDGFFIIFFIFCAMLVTVFKRVGTGNAFDAMTSGKRIASSSLRTQPHIDRFIILLSIILTFPAAELNGLESSQNSKIRKQHKNLISSEKPFFLLLLDYTRTTLRTTKNLFLLRVWKSSGNFRFPFDSTVEVSHVAKWNFDKISSTIACKSQNPKSTCANSAISPA